VKDRHIAATPMLGRRGEEGLAAPCRRNDSQLTKASGMKTAIILESYAHTHTCWRNAALFTWLVQRRWFAADNQRKTTRLSVFILTSLAALGRGGLSDITCASPRFSRTPARRFTSARTVFFFDLSASCCARAKTRCRDDATARVTAFLNTASGDLPATAAIRRRQYRRPYLPNKLHKRLQRLDILTIHCCRAPPLRCPAHATPYTLHCLPALCPSRSHHTLLPFPLSDKTWPLVGWFMLNGPAFGVENCPPWRPRIPFQFVADRHSIRTHRAAHAVQNYQPAPKQFTCCERRLRWTVSFAGGVTRTRTHPETPSTPPHRNALHRTLPATTPRAFTHYCLTLPPLTVAERKTRLPTRTHLYTLETARALDIFSALPLRQPRYSGRHGHFLPTAHLTYLRRSQSTFHLVSPVVAPLPFPHHQRITTYTRKKGGGSAAGQAGEALRGAYAPAPKADRQRRTTVLCAIATTDDIWWLPHGCCILPRWDGAQLVTTLWSGAWRAPGTRLYLPPTEQTGHMYVLATSNGRIYITRTLPRAFPTFRRANAKTILSRRGQICSTLHTPRTHAHTHTHTHHTHLMAVAKPVYRLA